MAEICVTYLSEDETVVGHLVTLLKKHWTVWWAHDIAYGDWEEAVRNEIDKSIAVVSVLSQHAKGKRKKIIKDEMRYAEQEGKIIFPFLIGPADIPFGFGDLNHTEANGWDGSENHPGYLLLENKISETIGPGRNSNTVIKRPRELSVRGKTLHLPAFIFSLSSHETQVNPKEGAILLQMLEPTTSLISAYDIWKYYSDDPDFHSTVKQMKKSQGALFMDSGNYEAYRKNDRYSVEDNPKGWRRDYYREIAAKISPDIVFSFDHIDPEGEVDRIIERIVSDFRDDDRDLRQRDFLLCPIVHLPKECNGSLADCAARIVSGVASELNPPMLAIPERELGDGMLERAKTVRDIRTALNSLGKYYPLHLLGTGNPLSMIVLAAAGADAFDGLEWCRTVADYDKGFLFHFQQFDFFSQTRLHQIQDPRIRRLIENADATYSVKALGFNVDFFKDWTRTMRGMIHSGQTETLLKTSVPNIGSQIFKELFT
jgi:hypothetical protein